MFGVPSLGFKDFGYSKSLAGTRECCTTSLYFKDIEECEMYEHYFHFVHYFIHYFQKEIRCSHDTQVKYFGYPA